MKVFVIGFNKCGTTSLHEFFKRNGIASVHYDVVRSGPNTNLAKKFFDNREKNLPLLDGIDEFQVYTDMEHQAARRNLSAYLHFDEIDAQYPGSRFILNLRDKDSWLKSRANHNNGRYAQRQMVSNKVETLEEVTAVWSDLWDSHIAKVRAHFADRPDQLLEFRIDEDEPRKIADFLPEWDLDPAKFGRHNVTPGEKKN